MVTFSIRSILCNDELKNKFFAWISGKSNSSEDFNTIDFLFSPISESDFPENINWQDIINYANFLPYKNPKLTDIEVDELKIQRINTAERLFEKFLNEGLSKNEQAEIQKKWNEVFNSFSQVDYKNFDYSLYGFSESLNGNTFILHEQQKKGIAFLCSKGNGLLAYDVGVGKTATGIGAAVHQIQNNKCKRPLIIVPKAVYSKWINDIKALFPKLIINPLNNLNMEVIDELRMNSVFSEINKGKLLPEGAISICTIEALENIYFKPDTIQKIFKTSFKTLLSENKITEFFKLPSNLNVSEYVYFEDLAVDLIIADEAHRYKNLFKKVTSNSSKTEFSNFGFGEPSSRALKMFAVTEYIHRQNNEKNVFFLSATPFTNSPMEIYSMLRFLGGNEICNMGFTSINEFLNEFAEIKIEWTINNKGQVVRKVVMKNFRSLHALQLLIQHYIDKVSADDANIQRPEKFTHLHKLLMTDIQQKIYEHEIQRITDASSLGAVFKGMNNMRSCMISPALVNETYEDLKIPPISDFVTSSPKLMLICSTVINVYKEKPFCGQVIYLPRGVKESTILKKYLVENGIPAKNIDMINSSTTELKKKRITENFNNPKHPLKILIGSETISEGVDLNGNSLVMYNCLLGWNPTEPIQVEGRIWRQGNLQKKVHIVYPLIYNSIDSLIYQKHDEKATRIDAIWNYRGDKINVEEINPAELKFDLIKDPEKKAALIIEKESIPLLKKQKIISEGIKLLELSEHRAEEFILKKQQLEQRLRNLEAETKTSSVPSEISLGFSNLIEKAIEAEKIPLKKEIAELDKKINYLDKQLNKKLNLILGENFTEQDKQNYLKSLETKENEIEEGLKKISEKKEKLAEEIKTEYQQNEKNTVTPLSEQIIQLSAQILSDKKR